MARMIVALLALSAVTVVSAVKPQIITFVKTDCQGDGTVTAPVTETSCTAVDATTPALVFQTITATDCTAAGESTYTRTVWTHTTAPASGDECPANPVSPVKKDGPTTLVQKGCEDTSDTASQTLRCPEPKSFNVNVYGLGATPATAECKTLLGSSQFPVLSTDCQLVGTIDGVTYYVKGAIDSTPAAKPAFCYNGASGKATLYTNAGCTTAATGEQSFTIAGSDPAESPCTNVLSTATQPAPLVNYQVSCTPPSSSSCFSAGSKVTVEDGSEVAIEDVEIGQRVLAVDKFGKTFYDRVFRITHHDHVSTINYVRLTTSEGSVLELSGNHYLHVNACCDLNNVVLADDVKVGDTVFVMKAGSETAAPVAVTKKENVLKQGAFNVHVLNGNIVVNGVVATHFTTESAWQNNNAATAWYHVQDAVYRVTGMAPRPE